MLFQTLLVLQASALAFPQSGDNLRTNDPNSPLVVETLTKPEVHEFLTRHEPPDMGVQSPIENVFQTQMDAKAVNKQCGPVTGCPAWEGDVSR